MLFLNICVFIREQGAVKRRGYSSRLTSFSEMDDSEEDPPQNDIIQNTPNTLDDTENNEVCLRGLTIFELNLN